MPPTVAGSSIASGRSASIPVSIGCQRCFRKPNIRHNPRMAQRDIGLILMRQLADGLAVPVLLADENGDLLFFNEAAERLLGQRFDDVGELPLAERRAL